MNEREITGHVLLQHAEILMCDLLLRLGKVRGDHHCHGLLTAFLGIMTYFSDFFNWREEMKEICSCLLRHFRENVKKYGV